MLTDLVANYMRTVPIDETMAAVAEVSAFDRYQASHGIEDAAAVVAERAQAAGVEDVRVERFPADGRARWWTFEAPVSWTPTTARLEIWVDGSPSLTVDHASQPFSVATYSCPTSAEGIRVPLVALDAGASPDDVTGAIVVTGWAQSDGADGLDELAARGAAGFVTDGPSGDAGHPGRIELRPDTSLFGFSVTPCELARIRRLAHQGALAHALIAVDATASMPVVTGVLGGDCHGEEIWLTAHLCHPRPSANDNASGVAASLGAASVLASSQQTERTIRFVWGPEFVGGAAFLHSRVSSHGEASVPSAVVNLDMVGEDQSLCGGPFLVERSPECRPALIGPIAEAVVREVFSQTRNRPGTWSAVPTAGSSDHALFAGPQLGAPAIALCHAPDRFNHSAADSLDKVSPVEMGRATTAAATLVHLLASDRAFSGLQAEPIVREWRRAEVAGARRIARQHGDVERGRWGSRLVEYVERYGEAVLSLLDGQSAEPAAAIANGSPRVTGHWSGPLNLRAMIADLPPPIRSRVGAHIRADKSLYALLHNLAIRADGRRTRDQLVDEASFALRRPVEAESAAVLLDALFASGWATEDAE